MPETTLSSEAAGGASADAPHAVRNAPGVLLVTPWYGGNLGGVAVSVAGLRAALAHEGVPATVYLPSVDDRWPQVTMGTDGERVVRLGVLGRHARRPTLRSWSGYLQRWGTAVGLLAWLRARHGVRLVHLQYCMPEYGELCAAARAVGLPIVATFRGSEINEHFDETALAPVIRRVIREASRLTTVSAGLGRELVRRAPDAAAKLTVVRNALPRPYWEAHRSNPVDVDAAEKVTDVLFCGNFDPVKGPDVLLEAWRHVHDRHPCATLTFAGSGSLESSLRARARELGLETVVRFPGRIARDAVAATHRSARILAVPSRAEGMPLVALEAGLVGTPVVGTAVGGVPEAIGDGIGGLVVPSEDPHALAGAIVALLKDEERRRTLGAQARARVLAEYAPPRMAREYMAVYAAVLSPSRSA